MRRTLSVLLLSTILVAPALGQETINYSYDTLGRLTSLARTGGVNNGAAAAYSFDKAGNRTSVSVTGVAPPATPSFAVSDTSVTEGGALTFTATLSGSAGGSHSVNYATAAGTAASGTDFTAGSGTLTFAANGTKTVTVATVQDATVEPDETMTLNLSGATGGAAIWDGQGVGTIVNDDSYPPPSFTINDVSVTEGGTLVFTITKTGTTDTSYSVNYATAGGTATSGTDFTAISGTLTFAPSETSKTVSVSTVDDTAYEAHETLVLNLSGATGGAAIPDSQGIGTIGNNDNPNQPPTTAADSTTLQICQATSVNVVANDTDPEGNYPLTLLSVTQGRYVHAEVDGATNVSVEAGMQRGTDVLTYTVKDSLGAQSTGTLTVNVAFSRTCE